MNGYIYSYGQKFTYTHHEAEFHGNVGLLMRTNDCTTCTFTRKKKQDFGAQVLIYFKFSEINTGQIYTYSTPNIWLNVS